MIKKIRELKSRVQELSLKLQDSEAFKDRNEYEKVHKELSYLDKILSLYNQYEKTNKDIEQSKKILEEEKDPELRSLAKEELSYLEREKPNLEAKIQSLFLPKDLQDEKNIILEIRAGAGGDEASLFAEDLFRSYCSYANSQKWKIKILSLSSGNTGGIKEVIASVTGKKVFSLMKYESGVHRVQRVPKTESQGRIHTSTVTVVALPEAEKVDIDIQAKDLRIDVYRSSGHGGQSVNTTDSAVRVTHLPTGLVVTCQEEKSQYSNKEQALKVLAARLLDLETKKAQEKASSDRLSKIGRGNRSEKIRTYNFPQSRITDHRLPLTLHRLEDVMNGKWECLIDPLVTHFQTESLKQKSEGKDSL